MVNRVRVKVGAAEVEFEGDGLSKNDVLEILTAVSGVSREPGVGGSIVDVAAGQANGRPTGGQVTKLSVTQVCQKLGAKTGPDLVTAALAHLHFGGEQESSRGAITTAMRSAPTYFKKNYLSNLSKILDRLVKDSVITHTGNDRYSLMESTISQLAANFV
jgi:hypothetical protein